MGNKVSKWKEKKRLRREEKLASKSRAEGEGAGQTSSAGEEKQLQAEEARDEVGDLRPSERASDAREARSTSSGVLRNMVPDARLGDLLKGVPLLKSLSESERDKLGGAMTEEVFADGEIVFNQGDEGRKFFVIIKGVAQVLRTEDDAKDDQPATIELMTLHAGDYFGERALRNNAERMATVKAAGELQCLSLGKREFDKLFGAARLNVQFLERREAISAERAMRSVFTSSDYKRSISPQPEKDQEIREVLKAALTQSILTSELDEEHTEAIVDHMSRSTVPEGATIIREGDLGEHFYVIYSGCCEVFQLQPSGEQIKVDQLSPGRVFGELALMYNAPRNATVIATEETTVYILDRYTFRRIAKNIGMKRLKQYAVFMQEVELLQPLSQRERAKVAEAFEEVNVPANTVLFRQGDIGDAMYIVEKGRVFVSKVEEPNAPKQQQEHWGNGELKRQPIEEAQDGAGDGEEEFEEGEDGVPRKISTNPRMSIVVNTIEPGDYFGERALLVEEPRAATVRTGDVPVKLLKLDRAAFKLLLGPLEGIMKKKVASYDFQPEKEIRFREQSIPYESLDIVATLGKGSYGYVQLVKEKTTGTQYALKRVSKRQVIETKQQGHIMSEKEAMMTLQHPFLVRMFATYKSKDYLYFLLEPVMGGELFTVLRKRKMFPPRIAKFYAAHIVLALEYMHRKQMIYRDLKPENLLLDADGYLKVTDFGFAKKIGVDGKTWTLCGTPEFLAPEIVSGKGHGFGVDWWTLGVLCYEMLASVSPFYSSKRMKMYQRIVRAQVVFPSHFSSNAKNIIAGLLARKPTMRLGIIKGGATRIKRHPWFKSFDWKGLAEKKLTAPIIPEIVDPVLRKANNPSKQDSRKGMERASLIQSFKSESDDWDASF